MPEKATGVLSDFEKGLKELFQTQQRQYSGMFDVLDTMLRSVEGIIGPFSQVQDSAIELAKAIGLTSKGIMGTATRLVEQNRRMQLSMSYNISNKEVFGLQSSILSKLQRNVAIDQVGTVQRNENGDIVNPNFDSELENLVAASKVFGPEAVSSIVGGFDRLGKSMKTAAKATGKLFQEAGEYGLNLQKYTENFVGNLDMAQMYNFRKGVDGLKEMARKATEIRQDMKQIASFADKVGSVTGAVETAANLQVLGGSFAAMSNPLAMLNESLTDMEGLQDRFNTMTAGAARYNSVTHEIEMDPVTRQIMKRAAESMGVDPKNLIDQAYAQARRGEIESQMTGLGGLRADVQKMLPNIGEIDSETGVAGATIGGQFYSLGEIAGDTKLQEQLVEETRSESDDIKVIAKEVMGIRAMIEGRRSQMENEAAYTNIRDGVFSGISSYDMVLKYINEDFGPKLITAAGAIQTGVENLSAAWKTTTNKFQAGAISTFNSFDNPEQFGEEWKTLIKNTLGDIPIAEPIAKIAEGVTKKISEWVNGVNDFTIEQANINLLPGNTGKVSGAEGREPLTPADKPTANPVVSDIRREVENTVNNGGARQTIAPLAATGELGRATITMSFPQEVVDTFSQFINGPIPVSLAGATVAGLQTAQGAQTTGQTGAVISQETVEKLLSDFGYKVSLGGMAATTTQATGATGVQQIDLSPEAINRALQALGFVSQGQPMTAAGTAQATAATVTVKENERTNENENVAKPTETNETQDKAQEQGPILSAPELPQELVDFLSRINYVATTPVATGGISNFESTGVIATKDKVQLQGADEMQNILGQFVEQLKYTITLPITPTQDASQNGVKISVSDNSIPQATVAPTTTGQQTTQQTTGAGTAGNQQNGTFNLNVSGTLTMNVNGDNGKIGTVDIMRMIQTDDGFRRELAKALSDSLQRMQSSGQILNQ